MTISSNPRHETEKRRLRTAMARSRRRIDRHFRASSTAARRVASWKTFVRRHPATALAAGVGLGWLAAAGWRPRVLVSVLGGPLFRRLARELTGLAWQEAARFWEETRPQATGPTSDGGTDA